jgi:hypothetical protein
MNRCIVGGMPLLLLQLLGACQPPREGACVLESPPGGAPYLRRMAALTARRIPHSAAPVCSERDRGARLECEAVDDLSALTGGGQVCAPGGLAHQSVCPTFAEGRVRRLSAPGQALKPCGASACDNVEIVIDGADTELRVTFYDDPSCHGGPPEPICAEARHDCYYRVFAVQTVVKGEL